MLGVVEAPRQEMRAGRDALLNVLTPGHTRRNVSAFAHPLSEPSDAADPSPFRIVDAAVAASRDETARISLAFTRGERAEARCPLLGSNQHGHTARGF